MTRAPRENPISVMGRTPKLRFTKTSAKTSPAAFARSSALDQGLSMRYPNFERTLYIVGKLQFHIGPTKYALIGSCKALISAVMTVACKTVWLTCDNTSVVSILRALPVSPIISGSQRTLNTSPTRGSSTLNGNRTSSRELAMNLLNEDQRTNLPGH